MRPFSCQEWFQCINFGCFFSKKKFRLFFFFFLLKFVLPLKGQGLLSQKKPHIRETSNLSTDADSSTNATVGWTKNKQKPKKN